MGAEPTKLTDTYQDNLIFEQAKKRLQSSPSICDEDKTKIVKLVDHLLAKGVSKKRAVKYINHLIVFARIAAQPLGQLDKSKMEAIISRLNTSNYTDHTKHDYKVIIKKYFQWLRAATKKNANTQQKLSG
jgi:hypothetical protein